METLFKPPELRRIIEENWERRNEEASKRGITLVNRPKVLLMNFEQKEQKLRLKLGRSDYKDFIGTVDSEFSLEHPELVPRLLAVCSVLETSDDYVLINERQNVSRFLNWLGGLGGDVELDDVDENGQIDPFRAALREASEETRISQQDIETPESLGFMKGVRTGVRVMMFRAKTHLTKKEIEEIQQKEGLEEGRSLFIKIVPDEMRKEVLWFSKIFVVDASAILTLLGRERFGEEWFQFMLARLRRRGNVYDSIGLDKRRELEDKLVERLKRK